MGLEGQWRACMACTCIRNSASVGLMQKWALHKPGSWQRGMDPKKNRGARLVVDERAQHGRAHVVLLQGALVHLRDALAAGAHARERLPVARHRAHAGRCGAQVGAAEVLQQRRLRGAASSESGTRVMQAWVLIAW